MIELIYLEQTNAVPCEVKELRYDGTTKTLWRAAHDVSFCKRKFTDHRDKLIAIGWPCGPVGTATKGVVLPEAALRQSAMPHAAIPLAAATTSSYRVMAGQAQSAESQTGFADMEQVFLMEDVSSLVSEIEKPLPPAGSDGRLNIDDTRQMDDWLMYLSSQSMESIRKAIPDTAAFEAYQLKEKISSDDIYVRLQSRIEFLNQLLASQQ